MDSSINNDANGIPAFRGNSSGTHGELERVKVDLQQITKKNQDLEEMLLFTTQELEKERENSRRIVQILTERLMDSREIINKLEMENMRYKKDCVLAVELLQCNKSVDQGRVLSTIKKLSDHASKPQASQNSYQNQTGTISMTENQPTMVNRNEIPSNETKVFQKPTKTMDGKNRNNTKDVENVETALLREEKLVETSNMKREQLVPNIKQRSASAEKESLLTQGEDFLPPDTPSLSSSGRHNVHEEMPSVPATDNQSIAENKTQLTKDDRVLVKEDNKAFVNQKTSLQEDGTAEPLTSAREPLPQKDKTASVIKENNMATAKQKPLQTEAKSSLTDADDTKQAKEKTSMKDGEYLAKGDTPHHGKDKESLQDTSVIHDSTTENDSLADENISMGDDDSPLMEQEKLLIPEAKQSGGALLEKSSFLEMNTPASKVSSMDENLHAKESKLLANDDEALAENEKFLVKDSPTPPPTKEVKPKSSVSQGDTPSTEEKSMHEDKDTSNDKETEDDTFLAEEDTPLV